MWPALLDCCGSRCNEWLSSICGREPNDRQILSSFMWPYRMEQFRVFSFVYFLCVYLETSNLLDHIKVD
jgi:hypothetical protein